MLPGNRGTGTANEASVKSRKNARNTAPPRINIPPLLVACCFSGVLDHALQDFWARQARIRDTLVLGPFFQVAHLVRTCDGCVLFFCGLVLGFAVCLCFVFVFHEFEFVGEVVF